MAKPTFRGDRVIKWVMFKDIEIAEWTKNRLRYTPKDDEKIVDLGDAGRSIAYHTYKQALRLTGKGYLIDKYQLDICAKDLKYLRSLSEYFKKRGPQVEVDWRCMVDLHRLSDYLPYPEEKEFVEDIRDWVQRKPLHTWNGDEELWYQKFEQTFEKVLFSRGKKPREQKTVDWFCKNSDIWCTSGSGFEPEVGKLKVFDKDREETEEVKKNKWSVRWNMTSGKVKRLLLKRRKQICKAVAKSEPGKVRAVVSSDLSLYLKMSYISTYLDEIMKGRQDSTLFMSEADRLNLWQKMGLDGTWRMPIDQSEFDKNVSKRQVMIALRCIKKLLTHFGADSTMLSIMDEVIYAIDGGIIFVGGESIEYMNGILSGWRWTALLDTLINLTELDMAVQWVQENSSIKVNLVDYNAQGDDDWIKLKTRREAVAIWLAYESFGLFVNPGKFFLAKDRDEYLRRVMEDNVVTGYPARSVTSICFRSPLSEREGVGAERVRSVFTRWKLFAERIGIRFEDSQLWNHMIRDMKNGLKGSTTALLNRYCKLGVLYGGIGVTRDYCETPIPGTTVNTPHRMIVEGEGLKEWSAYAEQYGVSEEASNKFAVSTLNLAGSFGIPKWVKVIYSSVHFETSVPVKKFEGKLEPGAVFMGNNYRYYSMRYHKRWFASIGDLKGLTQFSEFEWQLPEYKYVELEKMNQNIRVKKPRVKPEITNTLAQLSEDLDLCYDLEEIRTRIEHKPKSWVRDFVTGKLSTKNSIKPGWGLDAVGAYAKTYLGDAISKFLYRRRPNLRYWDSLLASIDVTVSKYLDSLPVRVVE